MFITHLQKGNHSKDLSVFSKNEGHLRDILEQTDIIDWNKFVCLFGYAQLFCTVFCIFNGNLLRF